LGLVEDVGGGVGFEVEIPAEGEGEALVEAFLVEEICLLKTRIGSGKKRWAGEEDSGFGYVL
jgi:hypothetical protein